VQLFVERVTAIVEDFALTDENATVVSGICRRLDGLPLAIEFAAPRVAVLGIEGLAARLEASLRLLGTRRRVEATRHRTMRAVIDWSYSMLNEDEQQFFRSLSIFSGRFTVEAAAAVAIDEATTDVDALERLADLVTKSLVVADVSDTKPRFRLLDTTRAFALEKVDESGQRERFERRRAEYYRDLFEHAEGEAGARSTGDWLADYASEIDNLRGALDWAFSSGGDETVGMALTTAAVPLWMRLSLLEERGSRARQALGALGTTGTRDPREEMKLHDALGTSATEAREMGAAFTKELDIADRLGDREYQLRALHGLYFYHSGCGRYRAALQFARRFHDLAASGSDQNARLLGERMLGAAKHFLGDQSSARAHLEQVLAHYATTDHGPDVTRFGTDLRISVRGFLARVLWMQGLPDQAMRTAEMSVAEAHEINHVMSLCYALALAACPIALWVGDLTAAVHYTEMLVDQSRKHGLSLLSIFASRFQRVVALKGGDLDTGLSPPRAGAKGMVDPNISFGILTGLTEQAEAMGHAGQVVEATALLEAGIEQCEPGWLTPELLRLKGELMLLQGAPAAVEKIEGLFRQALDESRQQEVLPWQLRAATSLARLLRDQGRGAEGNACLRQIYDSFTEGFGTADLIVAKQILDESNDPGGEH